jgi:glycosyltransferase involved in cell wall biosynthesis
MKASPLPHILFVVGQLSVGGIETYVVRMARAYNQAGGKVSVWVIKYIWDPELLSILQEVADVTFVASSALRYPAWVHSPDIPDTAQLIFTTGRLSLLFAAHACARTQRPIRLVAGVFSQWEYCSDDSNLKSALAADILRQIGPLNMVFCTEGCRRDHQARFGDGLASSLVSPLLIDLPAATAPEHPKVSDLLQIVSVSRLVSFKTSNRQMPDIIRQLGDRGVDAYWTHYGDGPDRKAIETAIEKAGVESRTVLAGAVPYSELYKCIARADLYIGGGTTLIEAAALGIPALVALDENPFPTSPGFFSDRKGHFTSDASGDEVTESFVDYIERFSKLPFAEIVEYRRKSIQRARQYSTDNSTKEISTIIKKSRALCIKIPSLFQFKYFWSNMSEIFFTFLVRINLAHPDSERRR